MTRGKLRRLGLNLLFIICYLLFPPVAGAAYDPNNLISDDAFIAKSTLDQAGIESFLNTKGNLTTVDASRLGAGTKSTATIINEAAQKYSLNPQVILVTLQKEQSLITATAPSQRALDLAMGFGVYPGSPYIESGHPLYAGSFVAQVENGTRVLREHFDAGRGPGSSKVNETVDITLKDGSSETRRITLTNRATAALYRYTPYVENGNKNFVSFFESYFGTYSAAYLDQEGHNSAATVLSPKEEFRVKVRFRNTGTTSWKSGGGNPVKLGTTGPRDRTSAFLSGTRAATLTQSEVKPGELGTFEFLLTAPTVPGTYQELFQPLAEGLYWFGPEVSWTVTVGTLDGSFINKIGAWGDNRFHLQPGQSSRIYLQYRNTGTAPWLRREGAIETNLGTWAPQDHPGTIIGGRGRAANLNEPRLSRGEVGTFEFDITAPATPGLFRESFRPVLEGVDWFGEPVTIELVVEPFNAALISQSATTYELKAGEWVKAWAVYKNTGLTTWDKTSFQVKLGTIDPQDRLSPLLGFGSRAATVNEGTVKPGESAGFEILFTAPAPGRYREVLRPVAEGSHWFGQPVAFDIIVK